MAGFEIRGILTRESSGDLKVTDFDIIRSEGEGMCSGNVSQSQATVRSGDRVKVGSSEFRINSDPLVALDSAVGREVTLIRE